MKIFKINLFVICLLGICNHLMAQKQYPIFFEQTKMLYNPSFTGTQGSFFANGGYQFRTDKLSDQYLLLSKSMKDDRIGVGGSFTRSKAFVQSQIDLYANFSYNVPVSDNQDIYFGIRAGGEFYSVDASELESYDSSGNNMAGSDSFLQSKSGKFEPNIGVGVHYRVANLELGVSVPKLLNKEELALKDGNVTKVSSRLDVHFLALYNWNIGDNFLLKPYSQVIYTKNYDTQIEYGATLNYQNFVDFVVSHRVDNSVNGGVYFSIPKTHFIIGYGFGMSTQNTINLLKNIHEIGIQYRY